MKNGMNKILATGILALTAMFAGGATAGEKFNPGQTRIETTPKLSADSGTHIVVARSVDKKHDSTIVTIQKSQDEKVGLGADGKKVGWGLGQDTKWLLFKHSRGWVLKLASDMALAVTRTDDGGLVLQRDNATANQVWEIEADRAFVE